MNGLTIGDVARKAQVNVETLRYYERRGLLAKPPRSDSNYRLYPEDAVKRVRFIRRAQELGFTLKEIGELLSLRATAGASCKAVRQLAEEKIADVNEKIRTLEAMHTALAKLVAQCSGQGPITDCPILETLDSENDL